MSDVDDQQGLNALHVPEDAGRGRGQEEEQRQAGAALDQCQGPVPQVAV